MMNGFELKLIKHDLQGYLDTNLDLVIIGITFI